MENEEKEINMEKGSKPFFNIMMNWKKYLKESTDKSKIIDLHNYNLSNLYSEFNRKYFENKLPVVPVLLKKLKGYGGITQLRVFKRGRYITKVDIEYIAISTFIETTEERLFGILAHEMCHVWVHAVDNIHNDRGGQHGIYFTSIFDKIKNKTPFKVPLTDETVGLEISSNVKAKQLYVVLRTHLNVNIPNKKYSVIVFSNNIQTSDLLRLKTNYIWPKTETIGYYISNERQLLKHKIKRKYTSQLGFYYIPDELAELIKKNGKYLDSIHPSEEKEAINIKSNDLKRMMLKYSEEKDPKRKAQMLDIIKNF